MFLHLSVSHSVHRGGGLPQCMLGYTPLGRHPLLVRHPPGQTPPPKTATAADGTHPTGIILVLTMFFPRSQLVDNPTNDMRTEAEIHNDYFTCQFVLSFPVAGIHRVNITTGNVHAVLPCGRDTQG